MVCNRFGVCSACERVRRSKCLSIFLVLWCVSLLLLVMRPDQDTARPALNSKPEGLGQSKKKICSYFQNILKSHNAAINDLINPMDPTLLILFTSWAPKPEKKLVQDSILPLWKAWDPVIKPLAFLTDRFLRRKAYNHQWYVLPEPKNPRCNGLPLLPNMFLASIKAYNAPFYGFANADIVFGDGLWQTIRFLNSKTDFSVNPFLMIGRRTNYDFRNATKPLGQTSHVKRLQPQGDLVDLSSDYFITNKLFPWERIPALSIGRPGFGRWVISYAIKHNIPLIDTTNTVQALHLTTADGTHSSWNFPVKQKRCNLDYILKQERIIMDLGYVECATIYTYTDKSGQIRLDQRGQRPDICKGKY